MLEGRQPIEHRKTLDARMLKRIGRLGGKSAQELCGIDDNARMNTANQREIAEFLAGKSGLPIVVATLPADIAERLDILARDVLLSRYTADKQKKHPEITAESFSWLQDLLNYGERLYDKKNHATVIFRKDKPYLVVLKATKNRLEVYLQSFRRSDDKNIESLKKRAGGG